jgi:hypothetical protein
LGFYSWSRTGWLIPWYFNLPADDQNYNAAWKHIIDTTNYFGSLGLERMSLLINIISNNLFFSKANVEASGMAPAGLIKQARRLRHGQFFE